MQTHNHQLQLEQAWIRRNDISVELLDAFRWISFEASCLNINRGEKKKVRREERKKNMLRAAPLKCCCHDAVMQLVVSLVILEPLGAMSSLCSRL